MQPCRSTCFLAPVVFGRSDGRSRRGRRFTQCNINKTSDSAREDEIAAKIASLRKQKRLKSQRLPSTAADVNRVDTDIGTPAGAGSHRTALGLSFNNLPDWKKEEVLQNQIADAERFLYGPRRDSQTLPDSDLQSPRAAQDYQPKVSTWGVFPRPDNISKTFGGGRRIETGGVKMDSSQSRRRDEAVKKKLAAYRASRGIDAEKEDANREQIEKALRDAERLMTKTLPYAALDKLEGVIEFTSDQTRLGGNVLFSLALTYEAVGKRQNARDVYVRLRKSPFPEIAGKAKQLLQGLSAMQQLRMEDETQSRGHRVTGFTLPDLSSATDKRYETVVLENKVKGTASEKISMGTSIGLFAVMISPALMILGLALWRR